MSPDDESERRSKRLAQREPDSREKESATAAVSAIPRRAGRRGGKGPRPAYRIAVRGPIPANLTQSISVMHASALMRGGLPAPGNQAKPERKTSKAVLEQRAVETARQQAEPAGRHRMSPTDETGGTK